jgi:hypothetical protein
VHRSSVETHRPPPATVDPRVNDHLKAIYRKTRTTGRDELTAALTS